jgi:hypothetical protein
MLNEMGTLTADWIASHNASDAVALETRVHVTLVLDCVDDTTSYAPANAGAPPVFPTTVLNPLGLVIDVVPPSATSVIIMSLAFEVETVQATELSEFCVASFGAPAFVSYGVAVLAPLTPNMKALTLAPALVVILIGSLVKADVETA